MKYNFKALFEKYFTRLCYFSFQMIGDKSTAEDIVQDAFIKYWENRTKIAADELSIKSYLYVTVRNASLNLIRHEKVVQNHISSQPQQETEESIVHAIIRSEVFSEIFTVIASLPDSCQRISRMGYLEGMKNKEIAETLNISVNTVKTQKKRALQVLRLKLKFS